MGKVLQVSGIPLAVWLQEAGISRTAGTVAPEMMADRAARSIAMMVVFILFGD